MTGNTNPQQGVNGPIKPPIVPGCDGAGVVEAIGSSVQEFQPGDRVVTQFAPHVAESRGDDAPSTMADVPLMLGQGTDGTLRSHGVFSEKALVLAPKSLDFLAAATLTCTWTTAWNSLFGRKGSEVGPDTWVLLPGTGGVSIATLQLAAAAGANVVATTSTEEKAIRLRSLGAAHTVNYRTNPENWGSEARAFTPNERGFDIVIDVGGNETLSQSLAAVRPDGTVMVVGQVGDNVETVPLFAALLHTCNVRGVLGGTRAQFRELVKFIDDKKIRPVVDDVVFELEDTKAAYRRLKEKKHFSKIVIRIDHHEV
jgi:NADPH:quinone reductase-like Zn-dependent oxidoreductase